MMYARISSFLSDDSGPNAVEYAVMLDLIVIAIVGIVTNMSTSISGRFSTVSSTVGS
jgi:Flp pilus assembly pilin Flp